MMDKQTNINAICGMCEGCEKPKVPCPPLLALEIVMDDRDIGTRATNIVAKFLSQL